MTASAVTALALALLPAAAQPDSSRIYGRITTVGGEHFEGYIRWDRNEVNWADILHASKRIDEAHVREGEALLEDRPRSGRPGIEVFGVRLSFAGGDDDHYPRSATSGIRFAHILTIEPLGRRRARLVLVSGQEIELESGGDLGPSIREIIVDDPRIGETELKWGDIERVEFFTAPTDLLPRSGERLYGTLETRDGERFTGYVAWDMDEVLTADVLDGKERGRDRKIRFGDIAMIQQDGRDASIVRLHGGEELVLRGSNDVNRSNRGIVITEPTFGQARVDWDNFRRLELLPVPAVVRGLDAIASQRRITGTVHTDDGRSYSGTLRWDNDEEFAWEYLNGEFGGAELEIEFGAIRSIERLRDASRVTLHDGREWVLRGSNDVDDRNKGIFVTTADGARASLPWRQVRRVEFDR